MSYDEHDAAMDALYDEIREELYPEAIDEFTAERLRSFYVKHPDLMRPAVDALQEGKVLREMKHYSAAVVFFVSAIELLLKATLLKPVVYGLVHHEALADVIVQHALGQTGFDRYEGLLANLFSTFAEMDLKEICRDDSSTKLLTECTQLQKLRNNIIHQGASCNEPDAEKAFHVSVAVYELIVRPMLHALKLTVEEKGEIKPV